MKKIRIEFILVIILIPILAYVGWQIYNSYIKSPDIDIEELELQEEKDAELTDTPQQKPDLAPKGTLSYTGYVERDPFKHSLPVKIKKPPKPKLKPKPKPKKIEKKKHIIDEREKKPEEKPKAIKKPKEKEKPSQPILLPKFNVIGIVWGEAAPRAIIDNKIYKIGDTVKGAKILEITDKGIHMIYKTKDFWINRGELR